MTQIHTDTDTIGRVARLIGDAQQSLAGGAKRKRVDAELQLAIGILLDMVDLAVDAADERTRRETEHQQTGSITFPDAA